MTKEKSSEIITILSNYYGKVKPGLDYQNNYQLTISVVLSAQTTDKQVNKITPELFEKYPNFNSLSQASQADIEKIIHSTGFYKTKAKNIISLSKKIVTNFNNVLPDSMNSLLKLPGVGRKSANVILSQGFSKPGFAVDTHVKRIAFRLGYTKSKDPIKIENDCLQYIHGIETLKAHLLFIHHGRNICKSTNPNCINCPLIRLCKHPQI